MVTAMSSRFIQPEQYKERVSDMFQRRAEKYDENDAFHPKIAENVLRLGMVESDSVVLDVATGTGLIAISAAKLLERSGRVVALDISSAMISKVVITKQAWIIRWRAISLFAFTDWLLSSRRRRKLKL